MAKYLWVPIQIDVSELVLLVASLEPGSQQAILNARQSLKTNSELLPAHIEIYRIAFVHVGYFLHCPLLLLDLELLELEDFPSYIVDLGPLERLLLNIDSRLHVLEFLDFGELILFVLLLELL